MSTERQEFAYCPYCATPLATCECGGRPRPVCSACGYVAYRNPTVGVAVVLTEGGRILLGRRAAGSSYGGRWCIPCGHVEWDEDIRVAARREMEEETGLVVELGEIVAVHSNFHNPAQHAVGIWFGATIIGGTLCAGDDLDRVGYYDLSSPPPLAFPTDQRVLEQLRVG
ncbi:MAG: NUDIX hydrolase [Myxococcota bacterium]